MGTIRELTKKNGDKSYHAEVRIRNRAERESFRTKTAAKKWIQDTEAAIRDGRFKSNSAALKHTVGDLIDRFAEYCLPRDPKYYVKKVQQLQRWKEELGNLCLADLSPAHIAQVRDKMLNETTSKKSLRSPSTVNRYIAAFSKALTVAVKEWGWIGENPALKISKPKEGRGRDRYLSLDEKSRLLEACRSSSNAFLYPIVHLALLTGMRYSEITQLKWKDINDELRFVTIYETKNGDTRTIPLTNDMLEVFQAIPKPGKATDHIFTSYKLIPTKHPISIRKSFATALKNAGIDNFRFHDLRHTAASHMAMGGATQGELMAILGHRSPSMTRRYAHYNQQHLEKVMNRAYKVTSKTTDKENL